MPLDCEDCDYPLSGYSLVPCSGILIHGWDSSPCSRGPSAVADLRRRTFRFSRWDSAEALQAYLKTAFLENPWYDEELPSLVYEESPGKIAGFLGVVPRPMVMHGKAIRAAVTTQFIIRFHPRPASAIKHKCAAHRPAPAQAT